MLFKSIGYAFAEQQFNPYEDVEKWRWEKCAANEVNYFTYNIFHFYTLIIVFFFI